MKRQGRAGPPRASRLAAEYLERAGLRILDRNWRCETGELDIVALERRVLVVCEVKTRSGTRYGSPHRGGQPGKRVRLRRLAAALAGRPGAAVRRGPHRRDRAGRGRAGRLQPRARAGGGLNAGRPDPLDRPGRGGGPSGGDRSRHRRTACPGLLLVGLPDTALREARDRIRAAIVNSREQWPQRRITVGLSPASLPKRGSGFDLGIAVAILGAAGAVPAAAIDGDGVPRRARARRPAAPGPRGAARRRGRGGRGFRRVAVPCANEAEAALVPDLRVLSATDPAGTARLAAWRSPGPAGGSRRRCADPVRLVGGRWPAPGGSGRLPRAPSAAACTAGGRRARPGRRAGPADGAPGRGDLRRGRPSSVPARPAGGGQDDAGRADSHRAAPPRPGRGPRGHRDPLGGRRAPGRQPAADRAAVLRPAPHRDQGGDRRRRQRDDPPRRRVAGPPRLPVPGRGARVRPGCA